MRALRWIRHGLLPRLRGLVRRPFYWGRSRECPCCTRRWRRFAPDVHGRPDVLCPGCGASVRHRALALFLRDRPELLDGSRRVLHFAPEPSMKRVFAGVPRTAYVTADLEPGRADLSADMTCLPFRDGWFGLVIVSHVLEHVPALDSALRELHRVLEGDGTALLIHPVEELQPTFEDPSIVDPATRLAAFGQEDHVRILGNDYPDLLRSAGFEPTRHRCSDEFSPTATERFGVRDPGSTLLASDIYVCTQRDPAKGRGL